MEAGEYTVKDGRRNNESENLKGIENNRYPYVQTVSSMTD